MQSFKEKLLGRYSMYTTIKLKKETKTRLSKFGSLSSSYDLLVNEILDHLDKCNIFWNERT